MNVAPEHFPPPLPPEVEAVLAEAPPDERAALRRAWLAAGALRAAEPQAAALERMGRETWAGIEGRLALPGPASPRADRTPRRLARRPIRWAVAACAVALVGIGMWAWLWPVAHVAPPGGRAAVHLPDGSSVLLNAASRLEYRRGLLGDTRRVALVGEAFFDVAPQERPFVVETHDALVRVVGTRFNVRAWSDDPAGTAVVLTEGAVRLAPLAAPGRPLLLEPGQRAVVEQVPPQAGDLEASGMRIAGGLRDTVVVRAAPVDTAAALAWRDGRFRFDNEPLGVVLHEMERRFAVEIRLRPAHLARTPISLNVEEPPDVEQLLADLAAYRGYAYRRVPGGFELYLPDR